MRNQKVYEADDKMISLIKDNYNVLQSLGCFGINLGFGDKTVRTVCEEQNVDTLTFLTVVNFTINGERSVIDLANLSVPTLLRYLKASHEYYNGFQLPFIRKELCEAIDIESSLGKLIMKLYDAYAKAITSHMKFEEKMVFPYIEKLLEGELSDNYDIDTYSKHHGQEGERLRELKSIIISICLLISCITINCRPRFMIYIIMKTGYAYMPKWRKRFFCLPSNVLRIKTKKAEWGRRYLIC